jgi:biotin operon repressor
METFYLPGGYWKIPKQKDFPYLTKDERFIVGMFHSLRGKKRRDLFASQQYIADELGCSTRTVSRLIVSLEKKGLLRKKKRGLGRTNIYKLAEIIEPGDEPDCTFIEDYI